MTSHESPMVLAARLALKSEHYASAFRLSAHIIRTRRPADEALARIFEEKAQLESDFQTRLIADPMGTLLIEGLIFP